MHLLRISQPKRDTSERDRKKENNLTGARVSSVREDLLIQRPPKIASDECVLTPFYPTIEAPGDPQNDEAGEPQASCLSWEIALDLPHRLATSI